MARVDLVRFGPVLTVRQNTQNLPSHWAYKRQRAIGEGLSLVWIIKNGKIVRRGQSFKPTLAFLLPVSFWPMDENSHCDCCTWEANSVWYGRTKGMKAFTLSHPYYRSSPDSKSIHPRSLRFYGSPERWIYLESFSKGIGYLRQWLEEGASPQCNVFWHVYGCSFRQRKVIYEKSIAIVLPFSRSCTDSKIRRVYTMQ